MVVTESDISKLRSLVGEINALEHRKTKMVKSLRQRGATWTEVGYALGITPQGAQKRYGETPERIEAQREAAAASAIKKARKTARKRSDEGK